LRDNKINVVVNFRQPLPPVPVTQNQMQQVLLNLILNAIDAVSQNGSSRTIWIDAYMAQDQLYLSIEDSGIGVPVHLEQRIFEPFFSTKPDGLGLGLMVSYGIIEAHGGTLKLVPSVNAKGANFLICLPYGV
jgi:C4-dicarboxylate-specific signal transduction histidine kinase